MKPRCTAIIRSSRHVHQMAIAIIALPPELLACGLTRFGERHMAKKLAKRFNCPTEFTLAVLGGKWKTVILCYLKERPCRYAELRKLLPSLSDKMLTERLADLVESGLIARKKLAGRRGADGYVLTARGR